MAQGMMVDHWVWPGKPAHPESLAVVGGCDGGCVGIGGADEDRDVLRNFILGLGALDSPKLNQVNFGVPKIGTS